jgi:chromate transporter
MPDATQGPDPRVARPGATEAAGVLRVDGEAEGAAGRSTRVPPWSECLRVWCRIGALSFGGPAGQIAVMQRVLVDEKKWIGQDRFLHALNFCMLLPGPEAMQLMTYLGWLMRRTWGGVVAGVIFVLPGFVSILALSILVVSSGEAGAVRGALEGVRPAILVIVLAALWRIARRALKGPGPVLLALGAFGAIFAYRVPFPIVIGCAALLGVVGARLRPRWFPAMRGHAQGASGPQRGLVDGLIESGVLRHTQPGAKSALRAGVLWGSLWALPFGVIAMAGGAPVWHELAAFFSQAALVTFGGAYAVLSYVAQHAVEHQHWMTAPEMLDGLAMAESTPGPLIQVVQHVGFLAAWREGGLSSALLAGVLASVLVTWVTFVPCFLWIFLLAPFMEAASKARWLRVALGAVSAAVVGVILNLSLWFGSQVLWSEHRVIEALGASVTLPRWLSLDPWGAAIFVGAAMATFVGKWGTLRVIMLGAAAGLLVWWFQ